MQPALGARDLYDPCDSHVPCDLHDARDAQVADAVRVALDAGDSQDAIVTAAALAVSLLQVNLSLADIRLGVAVTGPTWQHDNA